MKRPAAEFILAVCGCFAVATAQDLPPSRGPVETADHAELVRLEYVWNHAHLRGDAETLERIWADDLEVAVPHMRLGHKAELASFVRSGQMKFLRYETSDLRIRVYGSTAIVSGRLLRKRVISGRELNDDWRFTKVYLRGPDLWRVVTFHASESANP